MRTRSTTVGPEEFSRVRRRLELWRRRRSRGTPIPEALWRGAVALAQKHGVSRTSQALRLDFYSLKGRVEAARRQAPAPAPTGSGRFIEIPLRPAVPNGSTCVLEVEDDRGARLRLEVQGMGAGELASLVRSVWNEAR